MPTKYECRDCGHVYGTRPPALPTIMLHRVVSHPAHERTNPPLVNTTQPTNGSES